MSNVNYDKYFNMLTKKNMLQTNKHIHGIQYGGSKIDGTKPFGGFPPILMCSKNDTTNAETNKNREYSTHKTSVSIKDIMQKRRDIVPFISS